MQIFIFISFSSFIKSIKPENKINLIWLYEINFVKQEEEMKNAQATNLSILEIQELEEAVTALTWWKY